MLCDRFVDSWRVYQGAAGSVDPALLEEIERVSVNGVMPDMTLIFDLDPEEGFAAPRRAVASTRPTVSRRRRSPFTNAAARPSSTSPGRSRSAAS